MNESGRGKIGVMMLVTAAICLVVGANIWKSNLKISRIDIDGNRIVGTNELVRLSHVQIGSMLFQTDLQAVQQSIMSHYYIKSASVERNLPNTILIRISERIPIAMINNSEKLYFDEDGTVLPQSVSHKLLDLPLISGLGAGSQLKPGKSLPESDITEALQILAVMKKVYRNLYHNISEIQLRNGGDIVMYSTECGIPIIFGHGDLAGKIVKLDAFWNTVVLIRGPQNLEYIDLRFSDQIVAKWKEDPSKT
jgi:cell division protein FtsQ